jgi:hypothetical protein
MKLTKFKVGDEVEVMTDFEIMKGYRSKIVEIHGYYAIIEYEEGWVTSFSKTKVWNISLKNLKLIEKPFLIDKELENNLEKKLKEIYG